MRGVGDNGASRSPDHAAGNRCTGGSAGETSDQGTAARSDQRTAQHAILPCSFATGEHQGHHGNYQQLMHATSPAVEKTSAK
jgi:hypothetical protein